MFTNFSKWLQSSQAKLVHASDQSSLQYHTSIILLHRPFFEVLYRGPSTGEYDPDGGDIHSRSCQTSAAKISTILRIYGDNFTNVSGHFPALLIPIFLTQKPMLNLFPTQRCMPISAVHPAFTAAIIHLLDLKTADPIRRRKAMRRFEICLKCLYEMNSNWEWSNRAIRAIQSLATQWQIDIWSYSLRLHEIRLENRRQYQIYEDSCRPMDSRMDASADDCNTTDPSQVARLTDPFDEFFTAWTYDQAFMDGTFDFFDG